MIVVVDSVCGGGMACDWSWWFRGTHAKVFSTKSVLAKYYSARKQ